ncbi:MAG: 4-hydroxy-3-methylbut-2-enyl diphosphate reductase [Clostridia bacterium]|nr:4-hydroxy-3-methylbut-2-enyl diphosphate reductase [Clostridia bacterium]
MKTIVGDSAGICTIAQRVINRALEEAKKGPVFCLGEIVHNRNVTDSLKKNGVCFINTLEEAKGKTIIGAHGVTKEIYEKAEKMNFDLIDLTCPMILKIHKKVDEYSKNGFFIIIIGKANHAEILEIKSIVGKECKNIENKSEIPELLKIINDKKKILLISQTTYSSKKFDEIAEELKRHINSDTLLEINKTICPTTEIRQKETIKIAKEVDAMIIVGDKKSSNTTELYNTACKYCKNTQFVCSADELNFSLIMDNSKIGIMGGASTPKEDILRVKKKLEEKS